MDRRIIIEQFDNGYGVVMQEWDEEAEYYGGSRLIYDSWEEVVGVVTRFLREDFIEDE